MELESPHAPNWHGAKHGASSALSDSAANFKASPSCLQSCNLLCDACLKDPCSRTLTFACFCCCNSCTSMMKIPALLCVGILRPLMRHDIASLCAPVRATSTPQNSLNTVSIYDSSCYDYPHYHRQVFPVRIQTFAALHAMPYRSQHHLTCVLQVLWQLPRCSEAKVPG